MVAIARTKKATAHVAPAPGASRIPSPGQAKLPTRYDPEGPEPAETVDMEHLGKALGNVWGRAAGQGGSDAVGAQARPPAVTTEAPASPSPLGRSGSKLWVSAGWSSLPARKKDFQQVAMVAHARAPLQRTTSALQMFSATTSGSELQREHSERKSELRRRDSVAMEQRIAIARAAPG